MLTNEKANSLLLARFYLIYMQVRKTL